MLSLILIWSLLFLQAVVQAQNNSASVTTITSTTVMTNVINGPGGRTLSTVTSTTLITSTITPAPSTPTGNNNNTNTSTNGTSSSNSTTTQPSTTYPLAPTNIDGGGNGPGGAPSPGAKGGPYGPDDSYTAAASSLQRNALLVALIGIVVGGCLLTT